MNCGGTGSGRFVSRGRDKVVHTQDLPALARPRLPGAVSFSKGTAFLAVPHVLGGRQGAKSSAFPGAESWASGTERSGKVEVFAGVRRLAETTPRFWSFSSGAAQGIWMRSTFHFVERVVDFAETELQHSVNNIQAPGFHGVIECLAIEPSDQ